MAMNVIHLPAAAGIFNFIVLVAALSAMNSQLYITTRMMFSLSRAGQAPAALGASAGAAFRSMRWRCRASASWSLSC